MNEIIQKMEVEYKDLEEKILKLESFRLSDKVINLPSGHSFLMNTQLKFMQNYLHVLYTRIHSLGGNINDL